MKARTIQKFCKCQNYDTKIYANILICKYNNMKIENTIDRIE